METEESTVLQGVARVSPSYKEIFADIGRSLKDRRGDLFKRSLLIAWPIALLSVVGYVIKTFHPQALQIFSAENPISTIIGFTCVVLIIIFYSCLISFIVSIEKHLWIRSFFGNEKLAAGQSWKQAWGLLGQIARLGFRVFARYYLPAILALLALLIAFFYFAVDAIPDLKNETGILIGVWCFVGIASLVYFYYLRLRLRFMFFLFLDMRGMADFSYSNLFKEMKYLNQAAQGEDFRKALVVDFGSDGLQAIASYIVQQFQTGLVAVGGVGGLLGSAIGPFAKETVQQMISFARLTAIYVLYDKAKSMVRS